MVSDGWALAKKLPNAKLQDTHRFSAFRCAKRIRPKAGASVLAAPGHPPPDMIGFNTSNSNTTNQIPPDGVGMASQRLACLACLPACLLACLQAGLPACLPARLPAMPALLAAHLAAQPRALSLQL